MPESITYTNPSMLQLALFCEGLRIDPSAREALAGRCEILRTRAGLGSGLELILPGEMRVNVPCEEDFCARSPFLLEVDGEERFSIRHANGERVAVEPVTEPAWYNRKTANGKLMRKIGTLQGTYLGIYPTGVCDFWRAGGTDRCKYCSVGLNLGRDDAFEKTLADILEVVQAARRESGITYVDFNTGHHEDQSSLDRLEPLVASVKRETGLLIGRFLIASQHRFSA